MDGTFFKPSSFESTLFIRSYKIAGPWKVSCIYIDGMAIRHSSRQALFFSPWRIHDANAQEKGRKALETSLKKMAAVSQRFGHPHSQIPSVLGIPFSYYCSVLGIPWYPPGMPKSLVFWSSPPKKMLDFAGKSKTFKRWLPLNIEFPVS